MVKALLIFNRLENDIVLFNYFCTLKSKQYVPQKIIAISKSMMTEGQREKVHKIHIVF